ncbi:hypothetical protein IGI04_026993 [Brassica rapa subsp. trilocularis]|uniref:Uncharacterized protein n=1 Tax=Brassica rapa subsp. trilocularis TaxID=1813537 RepID=A0ABQ7L068_BRACM|nr:hypothetical protein IGI04_026993 [Brassica rapa subsp. trilocularis]
MNSNSKSTVCGNLISKKPNRKSGVSSAELVNRTGKTGVSPPNGKAVVFSDVPIKHSGGTGQMKNLELRLLTTLMLVLDVFLCLPEFKHWHGEVKANLAAACLIPFLCSKALSLLMMHSVEFLFMMTRDLELLSMSGALE